MARSLRLQVPNGTYHIMSRGNARQAIFQDDNDRQRFLDTLHSVSDRLNVICHAYCLMGNHYHLLLETPDANLSLALRQLNGVYAQSFNRRHGREGHMFQGRFLSRLVEKEVYLLVVSRYIVLNPVRAGLVSRPSDWTWSSFRAQAGLIEPPPFLTVDWLLTHFDTTDRRTAQLAFSNFVHGGMKDPKPIFNDNPILGSDAFVARFRATLSRAAPLKEITRVQRFAARETLEVIFAGYQDREDRNARIRTAHVDHGYTMINIADHLKLHPMTVSRAVRSLIES